MTTGVKGAYAAAACALVAMAPTDSVGAATWQNDWTVPASPAPLSSYNSVTFDADGDVLLLTEQSPTTQGVLVDTQFVRFTPGGAARWSVNIPFADIYASTSVLSYTDGSAVIGTSSEDALHLARIDAAGNLLWSIPFYAALRVDAQSIVATSGYAVAGVELATGHLRWVYAASAYLSEYLLGADVDAQGNVYAAFAGPMYASSATIVKLDAAGAVVWTVQTSHEANSVAGLIGVGADKVYFQGGSTLQAYRVGDGSPAWSQQHVSSAMLLGSPVEPIVTTDGTPQFERLDAATGNVRWSQPLDYTHLIGTIDGDLLTWDGQRVNRLGGNDGTTRWTSALTLAQGQQLLGAGGCSTAAVCVAVSEIFPQLAFSLLRLSAASGDSIDTLSPPASAQSVDAISFREDAGHVLAVGVVVQHGSPTFQARQLDAASGAELWRTNLTWAAAQSRMPGFAQANGAAVVAVAAYTPGVEASFPLATGHALVAALDDQTGAVRWQHEFLDEADAQSRTDVSAPLIDSNGDVFVAYLANIIDSSQFVPILRTVRYVVKLSSADGSELWRFQASTGGATPQIILLGNDLLVSMDAASANPPYGVALLSGSSGAVKWSSPLFKESGAYSVASANGELLTSGSVLDGASSTYVTGWARLDPVTGSSIWFNSAPYPACTTNVNECIFSTTQLTLPDGDQLLAGELDARAFARILPAISAAQPRDYQLAAPGSILRSFVTSSALDASGAVWLQKTLKVPHTASGIVTIAQFDPLTGTQSAAQAIGAYFDDAFAEQHTPTMLGAPQNGRLLVATHSNGALGPSTQGDGALDVTVQSHGDLVVSVNTDRRASSVGGVVGFHIVATYTGDAGAAGINLFAKTPWALDAASVTCSVQGASDCSVETRSGNLRAGANLMPDGKIDIFGSMRALPSTETNVLRAFAYGAPGLVEADMENNFATATIAESLFADGFE
jgi:PQQ-like domain